MLKKYQVSVNRTFDKTRRHSYSTFISRFYPLVSAPSVCVRHGWLTYKAIATHSNRRQSALFARELSPTRVRFKLQLFFEYIFIFIFGLNLHRNNLWFYIAIGEYWTRPDDQPIVKMTRSFLSYFSWKQMNDGNSSSMRSPLMKNDGEMWTVLRSMAVL